MLQSVFMELPSLEPSSRDREYRLYTVQQHREAVFGWLFEGRTHRGIDADILGLDPAVTKGYQSMGILHHLGLKRQHQGLFRDLDIATALSLMDSDPSYRELRDLIVGNDSLPHELVFDENQIGEYRQVVAKARVNQDVFRSRILNAYDSRCCITGMADPTLLRASHIKPWCECEPLERLDVRNGLCLNALHDCAFDSGLIAVRPGSLEVRLSSKIEESMPEDIFDAYFRNYDGVPISIPHPEFAPSADYLEYHMRNVFERKRRRIVIECEVMIDQFS